MIPAVFTFFDDFEGAFKGSQSYQQPVSAPTGKPLLPVTDRPTRRSPPAIRPAGTAGRETSAGRRGQRRCHGWRWHPAQLGGSVDQANGDLRGDRRIGRGGSSDPSCHQPARRPCARSSGSWFGVPAHDALRQAAHWSPMSAATARARRAGSAPAPVWRRRHDPSRCRWPPRPIPARGGRRRRRSKAGADQILLVVIVVVERALVTFSRAEMRSTEAPAIALLA